MPAASSQGCCRALSPGGSLAVEDIDFLGDVSYPPSAGHDRYVHLYREVVHVAEATPTSEQSSQPCSPPQAPGSGKDISLFTMIGISEVVLAEKLCDESELLVILCELETYTHDPLTTVCGPRVFQGSARRASL